MINIALIVTALTLLLVGYLILRGKNNSRINKVFSTFILLVGTWSWGVLFFRISNSLHLTLLFSSVNYVVALLIACTFLHFSFIFPQKVMRYGYVINSIYLPAVFLIIALILEPNLILERVLLLSDGNKLASVNWPTYIIYSICFLTYSITAYCNLFRSLLNEKNVVIAKQLKLILIGTVAPYLAATFFDLLLPPFNYSLVWIGPILGSFVAFVLIYAIYKHHLLNAKIIAAEFFTLSLCLFILVRVLIGQTFEEKIINITLLILTIIFGILLIVSANKDSRQKELLKSLNDTLEQKVFEQTQEIRKSYELEKKAHRELEKLNETKDQFIMITQHHLRAPVTNIHTELKSMTTEAGVNISTQMKKSLENAKSSTVRLARIVDDFLNITTLKVGAKILNTSVHSMKPILEDILTELKININDMNISINYEKDDRYWPTLKIDPSKIREAFHIIIENAVKYNKNGGVVDIITKIEYDAFEINVKNTGIGITYEEKSKLFSKLFFRGERAKASNPIGMGVGLSVARAIIRAHHGDITITSDGIDRGATVLITLPLDFMKQINSTI